MQELNKIKNQQYINLLKSFNENNEQQNKQDIKEKIKAYLNKSELKTLKKQINNYKNKQSNIIRFAILSF